MRNLVFIILGLAGAACIAAAVLLPVKGCPDAQPAPSAAKPSASQAPPAAGPNVVFILVDTLRADRIHAQRNGQALMPKLAAFAAEGRAFTQAISPASHTRAAVASLFTGQYVDTHGAFFGATKASTGAITADALSDAWPTIAEMMATAGYATWAFITNGNVDNNAGYAQGFAPENWVYESEAIATRVTDAAIEKANTLKQPFYLYLHYLDPHGPYYPPDAYREIFGPLPEWTEADRAALDPKRQMPYLLMHINQMFGKQAAEAFAPMTDAGKETIRIWYDAECRYIDDEVSRLVESLRATHPDTLFVFTSDHGEEFWEHQGMGHGATLHQEQIHVPLFIVGPKVAPAVIDQPVDTLSIFRTLADYLGQSVPIPPRGENLLGPAPSGTAYSRTKGPTSDIPIDLEAALQGPSKGIRNNLTQSTTVYDLNTDPAEQHPLPDLATTEQINTLLNAHAEENKNVRPGRIQSEQVELSPEQQKQLKVLGYEVK